MIPNVKVLEVRVEELRVGFFWWNIRTVRTVTFLPKVIETIGTGERWALLAAFRAAVAQTELYLQAEDPPSKKPDEGAWR